MRQIIANGNSFVFDENHLPVLVHGKEKSGASLFSVVTIASLCKNGSPIFFWSAYPMAKEEFYKEMGGTPGIHRIKEASEITGEEPQIIVMESDNSEALNASLLKIEPSRVVFAKNFETLSVGLGKELLKRKSLVIAGDIENVLTKDEVMKFETRIFFSPYPGIDTPALGKYEGVIMCNNDMTNPPLIAHIAEQ